MRRTADNFQPPLTPIIPSALAEHLQRCHEEVGHARVKATLAPGPEAAKRFSAMYPYTGAWAGMAILDMLDSCPPDAAHTGPDGDALRTVPLAVDVDAEFMGAYGVFGPGAPRGPAAYSRASLALARLKISHVNGTAIYGRDPDLPEPDDNVSETAFWSAPVDVASSRNAGECVGKKKTRVTSSRVVALKNKTNTPMAPIGKTGQGMTPGGWQRKTKRARSAH